MGEHWFHRVFGPPKSDSPLVFIGKFLLVVLSWWLMFMAVFIAIALII
ncbi:membrane protein [Gordonia phage Diabla]|nr:membrane protein [Gordonia phage Diabla]